MPRRTHTVILSSNDGTGNNNEKEYFVNWGAFLKDGQPYNFRYKFYGAGSTAIQGFTGTRAGCYITFSFMNNVVKYKANQPRNGYQQNITGLVPTVEWLLIPNNAAYQLSEDDSEYLYMPTRPVDNTFNVKLLYIANETLFTNSTLAQPPSYVLSMEFVEAD